jgi:prevent-host-death family protein
MEQTMSVTEARQKLLKVTKQVSEQMGRVVLTNKGRAETVLLSVAEYRGLRAAAELALHPEVISATYQGYGEIAKGLGVRLEDSFEPDRVEAIEKPFAIETSAVE